MTEFKSRLESLIPAEEILLNPTSGFGRYRFYLKQGLAHPAKMNTNLLRYLILHFTKQGETIVDPMCGSGSTGVVAALNGRNAIQVDIERKFFEWAEEK